MACQCKGTKKIKPVCTIITSNQWVTEDSKQNWHLIWIHSEHCNSEKTIDSCSITMWPVIPALQCNSFEEPKCNDTPATIFPRCHSCNFWLFPRIKTGLKGYCFLSVGKIQCNTTAGLIATPQEDFRDASKQWQSHWSKHVQEEWQCFKGD